MSVPSVSQFLHKYAQPAATPPIEPPIEPPVGVPREYGVAPEVQAVQDAAATQAQTDTWNNVKNVGLAGLGIGAGGAGLMALKNWLMQPKAPSADIGLGPSEVDLAYPQFEGADVTPAEARALKRRKAIVEREKAAFGSLLDLAVGRTTPAAAGTADAGAGAAPPQWWHMPAAVGAGIGGLGGGYALVNWLANKRRQVEQKSEIDEARKEYEDAMLSQYDPAKTHRILDMDKEAGLDGLFDRYQRGGHIKRANTLNDIAHAGLGGYVTLAGLLAGGTGYGMYKYLQSRSPSKRLEEALKSRAAVRATSNPPELFIHPIPVKRKRPLTEEADEAGSPVTA